MSDTSGSPHSSRANSIASFGDDGCHVVEHTVRPALPIASQTMKLSIIDQTEVRFFSSYVLCFRMERSMSPWQTYELLYEGLSRTLVQFPFLAGRLYYDDHIRDTLKVVIDNDLRVRFGYRDLSGSDGYDLPQCPSFDELEAGNFASSTLEGLDLSPPPERYPADGCRNFAAQANFVSGGVLLFFAHSHQVADATGTGSIMNTWSTHVTEAMRGLPVTLDPKLRGASMNRSRLSTGINDNLIPETSWAARKETAVSRIGSVKRQEMDSNLNTTKPYSSVVWYVRPERLQMLKKLAYPPADGKEHWISSMDALNALFWRQASKARALLQNDVDRTTLYFICNVRGRLSPPMRKDSVCNATMKLFASVTPMDLELAMPQSLQQAAFQIRSAIDAFSPERYERWIGYLQSAPSLRSFKLQERLDGGPDIVATDHSKVPAYSYSWGPLGRVSCMRKMWWSRSKPSSQCTIMPRLPDDGLEVLTNFDVDVHERLMKDPELAQFVEFRCQ